MARIAGVVVTVLIMLLMLPILREVYIGMMPAISEHARPHEVAMWELMPLLLFATILIAALAALVKPRRKP